MPAAADPKPVSSVPEHCTAGNAVYNLGNDKSFGDNKERRNPAEGEQGPHRPRCNECGKKEAVSQPTIPLGPGPPSEFPADPDRKWEGSLGNSSGPIVDLGVLDHLRL